MNYTLKSYKDGNETVEEIADYKEALAKAKMYEYNGSKAVIQRPADGFVYYASSHDEQLKKYEEMSIDEWHMLSERRSATASYQSVYIDVDGTAAYWYADGRGLSYPEQILDPNHHYFRDIEPHKYIIDLAYNLQKMGVDVCILTATDRECFADRWEWIENNMPFIPKENIFMCPIGADKSRFCKQNSDRSVLIDDYDKNLEEWEGYGVKSINNINSYSHFYDCISTAENEKSIDNDDVYTKCIYEDAMTIREILHDLEDMLISKEDTVKILSSKVIEDKTLPKSENKIDFTVTLGKEYADKNSGNTKAIIRMDKQGNIELRAQAEDGITKSYNEIIDTKLQRRFYKALSRDTGFSPAMHISILDSYTDICKEAKKEQNRHKSEVER